MKIFPTQSERRERAFKRLEIKHPDPTFRLYPPENFPNLDTYVTYLWSQGAITREQNFDYWLRVNSPVYAIYEDLLEKSKVCAASPFARRMQSVFV